MAVNPTRYTARVKSLRFFSGILSIFYSWEDREFMTPKSIPSPPLISQLLKDNSLLDDKKLE